MSILEIRDVSIWYGSGRTAVHAVDRVNLSVEEGEFFCIVGPSGCGKSTLLKAIAGLLKSAGGTIDIQTDHAAKNIVAGMIWQEPTLMPWCTIEDNAAFSLELRGVPARERRRAAAKTLASLGLAEFANKFPRELSGGMKQRVGIARALLSDPHILLMDEPFASVDAQTRRILQEQILELWREFKKTVLFVTHSIEEALLLGDRIAVMSARPGQIKTVIDVPFERPRETTIRRTKEFYELEGYIWDLLRADVIRAEMDETGE